MCLSIDVHATDLTQISLVVQGLGINKHNGFNPFDQCLIEAAVFID